MTDCEHRKPIGKLIVMCGLDEKEHCEDKITIGTGSCCTHSLPPIKIKAIDRSGKAFHYDTLTSPEYSYEQGSGI